jgi:hypothetical protein
MKERVGLAEQRIGGAEASKAGGKEAYYGIYLLVGVILMLATIAGLVAAFHP